MDNNWGKCGPVNFGEKICDKPMENIKKWGCIFCTKCGKVFNNIEKCEYAEQALKEMP